MPKNLASAHKLRPCFGEDLVIAMQDLLMLFYTLAFFAVAFLYVKACQKLR